MDVIQIENLWKKYQLGVIGHGTLTHDLQSWWARIRGKEDPNTGIERSPSAKDKLKNKNDIFWALKDINLDLKYGTVLGIIGRNGAGKSTLLKILSRVTAPTVGQIKIKGRMASLLEVGTGFHPELTGRENVFLNGAILGMAKIEIQRKLDEIIDFSGVSQHIDTPVKRYSSGMHVRLAFSVAAHLEPEILIVDEVLAVGNVDFQRKCLGKMSEVSKEGRTILFVSHNMSAIQNLCKKCILLEQGSIIRSGNSNAVIDAYLNINTTEKMIPLAERVDRRGTGEIRFVKCDIYSRNSLNTNYVTTGDQVHFRLNYDLHAKVEYECRFSISIDHKEKNMILLDSYVCTGEYIIVREPGSIEFVIEELPLSKGSYTISLYLTSKTDVQDWVVGVCQFEVEDGDIYGTGRQYPEGWAGKTVLVKYSMKREKSGG